MVSLIKVALLEGLVLASPPAGAGPVVYVVTLEGEAITPGTARYLERSLRLAEEEGAECLVLILDTPGGLLDSTRQLVKRFLSSPVPVVVHVAPSGARAASAGVFLTLAAHVAVMAPGTTIGAAHPVSLGGAPFRSPPAPDEAPQEDGTGQGGRREPSAIEAKIVNDTVAWARALAARRDRNADWAARAVSESLSLTAAEALEKRVVDLLASGRDDLLEKLDGRLVSLPAGPRRLRTAGAAVRSISMWWGERLLSVLAQPNVAFLLLIFGFYGILFELYSPGWGVPGILGVICLLLGFFGLAVLPVNYLGLALLIVALGLFAAEIFVTSFGLLALAGAICLVLGGVMLIDSPAGFSRVSLPLVLALAGATTVIAGLLVFGVVRAHRGRVQTGGEGLVGSAATAKTDFVSRDHDYTGTVLVHGELWKAVCPAPIAAGARVEVRGREGLTLDVVPAVEERSR